MKNSQDLLAEFYAGQLKRMRRLVLFLVICIFLISGTMAWMAAEQHKSNAALTEYIQGNTQRMVTRNNELEAQHEKLFKAISCLLILHDAHAISDPAVSTEECQKAARETNNELLNQSSMQTSPSDSLGELPSTTSNTSTSSAAPPQPTPPSENQGLLHLLPDSIPFIGPLL